MVCLLFVIVFGVVMLGLKNSKSFVPLISSAALTDVRDSSRDHTYDNVLLEFETAIKVIVKTTLYNILREVLKVLFSNFKIFIILNLFSHWIAFIFFCLTLCV